jgi:voltage-gated potassium channel
MTTVGYGDFFPVTTFGRLTGFFVMIAGVGIIGALASILASLLVSSPSPEEPEPETSSTGAPEVGAVAPSAILEELAGIRAEMAGQRAEIAALRASLNAGET